MIAYGQVTIVHRNKDGKILSEFQDHNMIVDQMISDILSNALYSAGAYTHRPLYRVGIGTGGYLGLDRLLPTEEWHDLTIPTTSIGSLPIDTITSSWDTVTHTLTIDTETVIRANDFGLTGTNVNEIYLIAGTGSAAIQLNPGDIGAGDRMVAYTTITNQTMNIGDTFDLLWTIGIRKDVV